MNIQTNKAMTPNISPYVWAAMYEKPKVKIQANPEEMAKCLAKGMGYDLDQLKVKTRGHVILRRRQMLMYVLRKAFPRFPFKDIGILMSEDITMPFDHTTVINAISTIQNLIDTEPEFKELKDRLYDLIYREYHVKINDHNNQFNHI